MNSPTRRHRAGCITYSRCGDACTAWNRHAPRHVRRQHSIDDLTDLSSTMLTSALVAVTASGHAPGEYKPRNGTPLLQRYKNALTVLTGPNNLRPWHATDRLSPMRRASSIAKT